MRLLTVQVARSRSWRVARSCSSVGAPQVPPTPPSFNDHDRTWVDGVDARVRPYLQLIRIDRPAGTWLLLFPCLWGQALATPAGEMLDPVLAAKFAVGSLVMRGAGCIVNDLWDRDIDAKVARTRGRPLASGAVTPLQAGAFLGTQLAAGLGVMLSFDTHTIALASSSLVLVALYPAMKRVFAWPQLFLGLTFNWGALVGWSAVHGSLTGGAGLAAVLPLYGAAACWTVVYDTLYAHQDKRDDAAQGLHSTALTFGERGTKPWLYAFTACSVGGLALAGSAVGAGAIFYSGALGAGAHMVWQTRTADLDDPRNLGARFASNKWIGGLVTVAIVADRFAMPLGG